MKIIILILALLGVAMLVGLGYIYLFHSRKPPKPPWEHQIRRTSISVGNLKRSYLIYCPDRLPDHPALVIAFHGSWDNGEKMRIRTAYEFEREANSKGFIVVYPDGFKGNWNDARKTATYPARRLKIDDEGFVLALISKLQIENGINPGRVFLTGWSNGGHMAYKLALEMPERFAGIGIIGANMPTRDNMDCMIAGKPIPVLIIQGTEDPLNPFGGGRVSFHGIGDRGTVLSTYETAKYFVCLNGQPDLPATVKPSQYTSKSTWIEKREWSSVPGISGVVLYIVHGGGHCIPQSGYRFPRVLGVTAANFDSPAAICNFFMSQPAKVG